MRILWLHQYFATPKGWGAVRTYEFARRFVKAGHEVDVVCCAGYDASLKSAGGSPEVMEGVRVFVCGTAYRPHMGFVRRICSFLSFMAYALRFVVRRGRDYDVMVASSGPLTLAVPALACRWMHGVPFVFEVIDVWPDSAIAAGVLRNPLLKWMSFRLEAQAYKYASAIITCSTGMTERVERKLGVGRAGGGVAEPGGGARARGWVRPLDGCAGVVEPCYPPKVVTISNCCDLDQFVADGERRKKTRAHLGVRDDQTVALYTGAMGVSNAVDDLVAAVKQTAGDERIVWWFAGGGPEAGKVKELTIGSLQSATGGHSTHARMNSLTYERLRFFGSLQKDEVVELYLAADVNIVTFMHEPLFYENSPNKFFDGIAAGLPAVFNRTTWLEPWLQRYCCGIVCAGNQAGAEMARQLVQLAGDGARRKAMGTGARRLAENEFSRDKLAVDYLLVLNRAALSKRR